MTKTTITIRDNASLDGAYDSPHYSVEAYDAQGNEYTVYWSVVDDWEPTWEDESDACDWDHPVSVIDHSHNNDEVIDKVDIVFSDN